MDSTAPLTVSATPEAIVGFVWDRNGRSRLEADVDGGSDHNN